MGAIALGTPGVRREQGPGAGTPANGPVVGPANRPDDPRLIDRHGRVATDLRVSLTDRCNLRCTYCMPPEGLDWLPAEVTLTDDEVVRLVTVAVQRLGVREVRFTGGEPLLRRGLERIVAATASLRTVDGAVVRTALTTNGLGLARRAAGLAEAGLHRVNVSLDTLDRARFARITGRDRISDVVAGLAAANTAGLGPIKVNAVLLRGINDDEAVPLLRWALDAGYELRFIEQMPLDPHGAWDRAEMVTAAQTLATLQAGFSLQTTGRTGDPSAPAETWTVSETPGGPPLGRVGVVASVTRPFCGDCDRVRLTSDGQVRNCLFARTESDLRTPLRAGAGDGELADRWRAALWTKRPGHGIDDPTFLRPSRPMSAIGG